jgi:hypothetical protein
MKIDLLFGFDESDPIPWLHSAAIEEFLEKFIASVLRILQLLLGTDALSLGRVVVVGFRFLSLALHRARRLRFFSFGAKTFSSSELRGGELGQQFIEDAKWTES